MSRIEFPTGFHWGCASAAYQIEGGVREGGRGESIWDRFAHTPGRIRGGETGDVACDSYHRLADDVALLREMGCTSYRFSIAWPRIQPDGTGRPNAEGVAYYLSSVIGDDSNAGTERLRPFATLAATITAASDGDMVIVAADHAETLTAVQTIGKKLTIVAEGASGGNPTKRRCGLNPGERRGGIGGSLNLRG